MGSVTAWFEAHSTSGQRWTAAIVVAIAVVVVAFGTPRSVTVLAVSPAPSPADQAASTAATIAPSGTAPPGVASSTAEDGGTGLLPALPVASVRSGYPAAPPSSAAPGGTAGAPHVGPRASTTTTTTTAAPPHQPTGCTPDPTVAGLVNQLQALLHTLAPGVDGLAQSLAMAVTCA